MFRGAAAKFSPAAGLAAVASAERAGQGLSGAEYRKLLRERDDAIEDLSTRIENLCESINRDGKNAFEIVIAEKDKVIEELLRQIDALKSENKRLTQRVAELDKGADVSGSWAPARLSKPKHATRGREWTVRLDKESGRDVGVDADMADGDSLVVEAVTAGLMHEWNKANPDKAVKKSDRIVAVNGIRYSSAKMAEVFRNDDCLEILVVRARSDVGSPNTSADAKEWTVKLERTRGEDLGVQADMADGASLVVEAVTGGLMHEWNNANPDKAVRKSDRIVAVNGIRSCSSKMAEVFLKYGKLEISVVRAREAPSPHAGDEWTVRLDKQSGQDLGVHADMGDGDSLVVEAVTSGLMQEWNKANPDKAVKKSDRIVAVNGIRYCSTKMAEVFQNDDILEILVVRDREPQAARSNAGSGSTGAGESLDADLGDHPLSLSSLAAAAIETSQERLRKPEAERAESKARLAPETAEEHAGPAAGGNAGDASDEGLPLGK